jgi:hypothetical protein
LNGLVKDIEWLPPVFAPTPTVTGLNYDKDRTKFLFFKHSSQKVYCDLNRICMIEDQACEWYEPQYYKQFGELFDLSFLLPLFDLIWLKYTGVDGSICKCVLKAKAVGKIKCVATCGMQLIVRSGEVCSEVKRIGYIRDRDEPVELRLGDTLLLYISTSLA